MHQLHNQQHKFNCLSLCTLSSLVSTPNLMFNPNPMQWYKQYNLNKSHSLFGFKCDM